MEEEFDINAFIDDQADEDIETLTIFVPEDLKVDSEDDEEDLGKYQHEELHKSTLDLIAAVHPTDDRITRDAAITVYPTTNPNQETLSYIGSWFDYYTLDNKKHCSEVNLYLEIADLSEWPPSQSDIVPFDSLKNSNSSNARKIYSSLVNRIL